MERICTVEGCGRTTKSRGMCKRHYDLWRKSSAGQEAIAAAAAQERRTCGHPGCPVLFAVRSANHRFCPDHATKTVANGRDRERRAARDASDGVGARGPLRRPPAERFWLKVDKTESCWFWMAQLDNSGYGRFNHGGGMQGAHKWAWEAENGPVPEGLHLDHRCHTDDPLCPGGNACRHRACVNPTHLELVTSRENSRRGRLRTRSAGYDLMGAVSWGTIPLPPTEMPVEAVLLVRTIGVDGALHTFTTRSAGLDDVALTEMLAAIGS